MNTSENIESKSPEDVIVPSIAGVETLGLAGTAEEHGQSIGSGIEEN